MINQESLEKFDPQGMHKVYNIWPKIARESFNSKQNKVNFEGINHIVVAGMGGSGTIGDMLSSILSNRKIHVNIVKGYHLPQTVNSKTLVIIVSVSGNTVETLSVLEAAFKLKCKIIAFSSGGKIQEFCEKNEIEYRLVPEYHSPRASFTAYFYSILSILYSSLRIKKTDIIESIDELEKMRENICSSNLKDSNFALSLAKKITGIPMIYYPWGLQSASIRFKNSLNENVKIHAMAEDIVEATHNGIVAWEKKSNIIPILIKGTKDFEKTKLLWMHIEKYFKENEISYIVIKSIEGSILTKLICLIYLCDYISIYLSVLKGTDPTPVKSIKYFKQLKI